jgi:hypothetical protein
LPVNKDNMRLWVAALRSGDYMQGEGTLHDARHDRWCCLGVACDVFRKNGGELETSIATNGFDIFGGYTDFLPPKVMAWLNLYSCNPILGGTPATAWNDVNHASFYTIADLIDKEFNLNEEEAVPVA